MLTPEMKRQIVDYVVQCSVKPLLEDIEDLGEAYEKGDVTKEELYDFLDQIAASAKKVIEGE